MEYMELVQMMGPWMFAGAAAFGGIKAGLNGQRKQIDRVTTKLDSHIEGYHKDARTIVKSLASLETKVDLLIDHKIKA